MACRSEDGSQNQELQYGRWAAPAAVRKAPTGPRTAGRSPRARELALARIQAEAAQAGASGIVGVNVAVNNHVWGEQATEFPATGTAIRRLGAEHRLPETSPKPTFIVGLDS